MNELEAQRSPSSFGSGSALARSAIDAQSVPPICSGLACLSSWLQMHQPAVGVAISRHFAIDAREHIEVVPPSITDQEA